MSGRWEIEPTSEAWEARSKNLKTLELTALNSVESLLNWKMMENGNGKQSSFRVPPLVTRLRERTAVALPGCFFAPEAMRKQIGESCEHFPLC